MANRARTSSVESLSARGFGTLTSNKLSMQAIQGASRWVGGAWDVVFLRSLKIEGDAVEFSPGGPELSIALAIWDGSSGDRNGQKSVTIWHSLKIEK
jgi:complex iron-sulfur molybdoenzyme family reductase subunit gamma